LLGGLESFTMRLHRFIWLSLFVCPIAWASPTVASTPTAGAAALDLDGEGSSAIHITQVADVTFSTANASGCTLTVSSGNIVKTGGLDITYKVTSVASAAAPPTAGDFTIPSGNNYTFSIATATSSDRDIYVMYTSRTVQDPGTYNESILLTVADN
jgi:hypothetical protein